MRRVREWEARHPVASALMFLLFVLIVGALGYWHASAHNARLVERLERAREPSKDYPCTSARRCPESEATRPSIR